MKPANISLARIFLYAIMITSLVLSLSPAVQTAAYAQSVQPAAPSTVAAATPPPPPHTTTDAETGQVRFMGSSEQAPLALTSAADAAAKNATNVAESFLQTRAIAFGLDSASGLTLLRETKDEIGHTFERFQQTYQGVPVMGGELIVQLDANKNIISANGKVSSGLNLSVTAAIDAGTAIRAALKAVQDKYPQTPAGILAASVPQLYIYDSVILDRLSAATKKLVWRVEVTNNTNQPLHELVLVDAQSGEIARQYSLVEAALNRLVYYCQVDYSVPGSQVKCTQDMVEGNTSTLHRDAYAAYIALGQTYNFFKTYFNRDSIDNAGKQLIAYTNISYPNSDWGNAYWDGNQMFLGTGFANDDVVGHEFMHGVIANTSGLLNIDQSGAINEAYSDIFGQFVTLTQTAAPDPANRWQFGADVVSNLMHLPLANMSHPELHNNVTTGVLDPDPDRISSPNYYCGFDDNGGIHKNSAVANKLAYLIVDGSGGEPGGAFNGQSITGIGIQKAAKLFNRVQNSLLISTAGYPDLADALDQACTDLVSAGAKDINGNLFLAGDCTNVHKAILATQMNQTPCVGARGYINPTVTVNLAPIGAIPYVTNILTNLAFTWRQRTDATAYQLQVKDSKGVVLDQEWLDSATVCLTSRCAKVLPFGLRYSETYSWRVQTRNPLGDGPWSAFNTFHIIPPAGRPDTITLTSPASGAALNSPLPTYQWPAVTGASSYTLKLNKIISTSPSTVIHSYYTITYRPEVACLGVNCSVTPQVKLTSGQYKVSVLAYFGTTASLNNDTSFSVNALPGQPVITTPVPNAVATSVEPTITWTGVTNATSYIVTVVGPAGTVARILQAGTVCSGLNCSANFPSHLDGGKQTVTVQSASEVGKGLISAKIAFSIPKPTVGVTLSTPDLSTTSRPTFIWTENPLAASYQVVIVGPTPLNKVYKANDVCPTPGTCRVTPGLALKPGSYSWTVKSINKLGSVVSTPNTFIAPDLAAVPSTPQLTAPLNAALVDWTHPLTLTWVGDPIATNFILKISGPNKYSEVVNLTSSACVGSACSWLFSPSLVLGAYSWNVQAVNLGIPGAVSKTFTFNAVLPAPVLNGPSGAQTLYALNATWTALNQATNYNVRLVDDATGTVLSNKTYLATDICVLTACSAKLPYGLTNSNYSVYVKGQHNSVYGLVAQSDFGVTITEDFEFNGNASGWTDTTGLGNWYLSTDDLYLSNRGRQNYPGWEVTSNGVDYSDMDLTALFQRDGCNSCLVGLVIRTSFDPSVTNKGYAGPFFDSGYQFVIRTDGYFSVRKYTAGKVEFLQKVVSTSAINTGNSWNRIRVVAHGNEFGFYINNTLVWLGSDTIGTPYTTGKIGFAMLSNDTNDNLNIDWIRRYSVPTLPPLSAVGAVAPAQQLLNSAANAQPDATPGGSGK